MILIQQSRARSSESIRAINFCRSRLFSIFECCENESLFSIPTSNIRNFSVIAHVDHGKSTLSDCILQKTGNIGDKDRKRGQVLDTLKVERDRGITVKAQTASMVYLDPRTQTRYLLNLIDTPGHVDFSYEVSRSLASCQGALLLVDSSQSIQAQTLSNFNKAKALSLSMIPIATKIDLPNAQPEETAKIIHSTFALPIADVIRTSAKQNIGIDEVLEAIIDRLPPPPITETASMPTAPFLGRIVDSWFDEHRGVVILIQVTSGQLKEGQRLTTFASIGEAKDIDNRKDFSVQEIGVLTPSPLRTKRLLPGQVGYVIAGMKSTRQARIGDTAYTPSEWLNRESLLVPLEGYVPAKQTLYASVFPVDPAQLEEMYAAVDRLLLNDSSISVARDQSPLLGSGLRCGFLGFLHMEVFNQRLEDEFNMSVIVTTPSVPYTIKFSDGSQNVISCVSEWPDSGKKLKWDVYEPMVLVTIILPHEYLGAMVGIVKEKRGLNIDIRHLEDSTVVLTSEVPWQEVVCDMSDMISNQSSGYASFNYETSDERKADLVKVEIAINGESCDPLSFVAHSTKAANSGRQLALKLKDVIARQQFEINIQARIGGKSIASERIAPYRKDVLSRSGKTVGGGDVSRKKKVLEKQKEGKKRAKMVGKVEINQDAFYAVLKR